MNSSTIIPSIIIRPFTRSDEAAIQEFYNSLGPESSAFFNVNHGNERRTMGYFDSSTKNHAFYAAMQGDLCVGVMFIWDLEKSIPYFGIAVRDDMQGKGVGTGMISYMTDVLKKSGYAGLLLDTAKENYAARHLYEKCGFEKIGTHPSGELLYLLRFPVENPINPQ